MLIEHKMFTVKTVVHSFCIISRYNRGSGSIPATCQLWKICTFQVEKGCGRNRRLSCRVCGGRMTDSTSAWQKMRKEVLPSFPLPFPSVISSFIVPPPPSPSPSPHTLIPEALQNATHYPQVGHPSCPIPHPSVPPLVISSSRISPHPHPLCPTSVTLLKPQPQPNNAFLTLHIHPSLINPVVNNPWVILYFKDLDSSCWRLVNYHICNFYILIHFGGK